ncbi:hypothetical protein NNA36_10670 [Shimia sp. CNT1-13L.2]|uniref:glucosamine inositolphosphorylceramide transferase family protein n=1 Tax=Shimia sp. CNT1-13L.2 TaxID=2959663 RepID=UPI0020CF3AFE|nr:hypothetical protein [Shimia sp. CNT1-13L.2]MCP9482425.1 hypothetical protein [Shimia sp. CNT1-13L.2]
MTRIAMTKPLPLFVTAADARYWRCLHQLLRAAQRKGWTEQAEWAAYDLGMEAEQRARLERDFPWVRWETFSYEGLPEQYVPSAGSYAWKAHLFWPEVERASGPVIWMDSANLPLASPSEMLDHIDQHGIYLLHGQAPLQERCDPRVLDALDVPRWTWGTRECVTGLVGVDAANPVMRDFMRRWCELSADPEIIRPKERIERHMNDQAVLNAIMAEATCKGDVVLPQKDVDISSGRPARFLSTRNKVRPSFPIWADWFSRAYYRVNKVLDQFLHRLDDFHLDHNPFWRMYKEYFGVHYKAADGSVTDMPCPFGHYYADPFLIEQNGETWAFFEDLNYFKDRATIAAMRLDAGPSKAVQVLDPGCHASFPFLFRHDGQLWMLPETCKNGTLELWRCIGFPDRWEKVRNVFEGVNCADSVMLEHDGRWWLITSMESPMAGGMYRYLAIFHSDDPVTGDWQAHPVNSQGLEVTSRCGTGRNAGGVLRSKGRLLRAVQSSRDYYGQGMQFREITTLTPEAFEERVVPTPDDLRMADQEGVHHLSRLGTLTIWDKRTRH